MIKDFYKKSLDILLKEYAVDPLIGLNDTEFKKRLLRSGLNKTSKNGHSSFFALLLEQYKNPLSYLLFGAAGIIFFSGSLYDASIIIGIVLLNGIVGTIQEQRISAMVKQMESLKKNDSIVIRNGKKQIVLDEMLVEGDIVLLGEGNQVPADGRIIEAYDFTIDESIFTGESRSVHKMAVEINQDVPLYQQVNMVFAETMVTAGVAKILIVATGKRTERGLANTIMDEISTEVPLQKDIAYLLNVMLSVIAGVCLLLVMIGFLTGKPFAQLLASITALFICIVPQGLLVIMTVVLVSGAYVVARKQIYIKRLQALETLGRTQVMIFDKTGTLTRNELMVTDCIAGKNRYRCTGSGYEVEGSLIDSSGKEVEMILDDLLLMGHAALLLNGSDISCNKQTGMHTVKGSHIEAALKVYAQKLKLDESVVLKTYQQKFEIPFHADTQFHTGFYQKDESGIGLTIGSPEKLFHYAKHTQEQRSAYEEWAQKGLRVVAVAKTSFDVKAVPQDVQQQKDFFIKQLEEHTVVVGCFGITDSLRDETPAIITKLLKAGIKVVMATGDHASTAFHLACNAHIADKEEQLMEGTLLRTLSDEQLLPLLDSLTVFARTVPADKLRLVRLYQEKGYIVTMLGDGVNDAPGLKAAHTGIAMGDTGSEITKQVADIVVLDNSFEHILLSIKVGRHSFLSFKRVILYYFTTNLSEMLVMAFMIACAYPLPLVASQILWLNLMTDGFLDYSLALEREEPHLLDSSWFLYNKNLISKELLLRILYQAITTTIIVLITFFAYHRHGIDLARTMTMAAFTICHAFNSLNCRSLHLSLLKLSLWSNKWLLISLTLIAVLFVAIIYTPLGQTLFKTVPLGLYDWVVLCVIGLLLVFVEEVRKYFVFFFFKKPTKLS